MIQRTLISAAGAVALAFVLSAPAAAQNVAGTWLMEVNLDAGSGNAGFTFEVDGATLTGTYEGILGEHAITGTIDGNQVEFGFESPDAGAVMFRGTVDGDTIEGTCEYGQLGVGDFTGARTG